MTAGLGLTVAIIPARGGSKGVPRKNVRHLAGKPLIAWTVEAALRAAAVDRVVVTTDDGEIAAAARAAANLITPSQEKCSVLERPAPLAMDHVQTDEVYLHVLRHIEHRWAEQPATLVLLTPTSPFRTAVDIDSAVALHRRSGQTVISVYQDARFHWRLSTPDLDRAGIQREPEGEPVLHDPLRRRGRQWVRADKWLYCENGAIYVVEARRFSLERNYRLPPYALYCMPEADSVEIDTEADWLKAEARAAQRETENARVL